jgi:peptide/nickel transport system ATP-binding protein
MSTLLELKNLHIEVQTDDAAYPVVEDVTIKINKGETFGIVGESGCGKSITSLSIMGLLANPPLKVTKGEIVFEEKQDLLKLSNRQMRKVRGNDISMIFQEPMTALDPLFTIEDQLMEPLRFHRKLSKKEMTKICIDMLKKVGIPHPEQIMKEYPHQLSGGMRQRIMIGIAMICNPKLLIADEPTTALDVTIQAQILDLMNELKNSFDTSILIITHDLGVIAETCQRVVVMYAGQVVEETDVVQLFHNPKHPYTKGLIKSVTTLGDRKEGLYSIPGMVPTAEKMPKGCRFADRCSEVMPICREKSPALKAVDQQHICRCWLYQEEETKHA